jgi:hypothetical protein
MTDQEIMDVRKAAAFHRKRAPVVIWYRHGLWLHRMTGRSKRHDQRDLRTYCAE